MATSHLTPVERYQGVQKQSTGYKLLASMGWKEGQGLGVQGQGIKEHIRVKKKFENWGVGAVESAERARDWSAGMLDFHRVLSNLSEVTSTHASATSDSDSSSSDDEAAAPTASASSAAAAVERAPAPRAPTHVGRFKRRESAKDVRSYAGGDLQAILGGVDPFASLAATVVAAAPVSDVQAEPARAASPPAPAAEAKASHITRPATVPHAPRVDPGAWWASYFERAGRLGSAGARPRVPPARAIAVHRFSENDQEELYTRTQDNATQGRVGLGRAGAPKKVAGARWAGTKTRLGSDSDDEQEGGNTDDLAAEEAEFEEEAMLGDCIDRVVVVLPPPSATAATQTSARLLPTAAVSTFPPVPAGSTAPPPPAVPSSSAVSSGRPPKSPGKKVKWKKLATAALQSSTKRRLKRSKLVRAVAAAAGLDDKDAAVAAAVHAAVSGSKKFAVTEKHVQLLDD